jgi:uncharacterized membrane protein YbhN (UPF0104 family)
LGRVRFAHRARVAGHVQHQCPHKEGAVEPVDPGHESSGDSLPVDARLDSAAGTEADRHFNATIGRLGGVGIIGGVACIVALVYLIWRNAAGWSTLTDRFDARYLVLALLFHSGALLTAAYTWHRIVSTVAREGSLARNVRIYVTSAFARRLPGSLWGPALRMYWYRRLGGDWRTVAVATAFEVWALTISGAILALFGAVLFIGPGASIRAWAGLVLLLAFLGVLFIPRVNEGLVSQLTRRLQTVAIPSGCLSSHELLRWVTLGLINWISGGFVLAAILRALVPYQAIQIPGILACWAVAGTGGMVITFVPGGFGVVELALTGLLGFFVPAPVALSAAIGLRVFVTASEILWMALGFAIPAILRSIWPLPWWYNRT